ncbi:hypothetical protein E2562_018423 [Oryza meyeriana var. granulata]|uniref:Protein kinase domain-containing protein n=1 Tax=Oryza meyeriana var. granulata TaxID=110450 RepID=A0A6G1D5H4_9ORYZ|nr:hypothetical protein E2562_018423 [Oryza meyeriana var. granulata]
MWALLRRKATIAAAETTASSAQTQSLSVSRAGDPVGPQDDLLQSLGQACRAVPLVLRAVVAAAARVGQALFPGDSDLQQLLGTPTEEQWPGVTDLRDWHEFPQWKPHILERSVPSLEPEGVDLLSKMLQYNPANRISAKAAMEHPYFDSLDKSRKVTFSRDFRQGYSWLTRAATVSVLGFVVASAKEGDVDMVFLESAMSKEEGVCALQCSFCSSHLAASQHYLCRKTKSQ